MKNMTLNPNLLHERVGDDTVIVNLENDKLFELNKTASFLFDKIVEGKKLEEIKAYFLDEYDLDSETIDKEIKRIFTEFKKEGVLI